MLWDAHCWCCTVSNVIGLTYPVVCQTTVSVLLTYPVVCQTSASTVDLPCSVSDNSVTVSTVELPCSVSNYSVRTVVVLTYPVVSPR